MDYTIIIYMQRSYIKLGLEIPRDYYPQKGGNCSFYLQTPQKSEF